MTRTLFYATAFFLSFTFLFACKKGTSPTKPNGPDTLQLSSIKELDSFTVKKADGSSFGASAIFVTITPGDSILITVPPYTDLSNLTPEFTFKGKSVNPVSGVTLNLSAPVVFTVTAEDGSTIKYTVIVSTRGTLVFGTNDARVFALDAGTGTQVWMDSLTGGFQYCVPQLIDSIVYIASTSGSVLGLDPASGKIKWQFTAGGPVASTPTISNGTVYFGSDDHNFYAVDLASAAVKWTFPTAEPIDTRPPILNGTVYFASGDGILYAVDAASGSQKWQFNVNGVVAIEALQLSNGIIYIGSRSDSLYAVDAVTGTRTWAAKADGFSLENSNPTVDSGVIYVGAESGSLFAFNAATGAQQWVSLAAASVYDQPYVYNNSVYVTADDGNLYSVNANTGAKNWSITSIYANGSGPIVAGGVLYVGGGGSRYFYAVDPSNGNITWKFYTGNAIVLSYRPLYIPGY